MNNGNTSIEFVSESGPIDFSVMMHEGVKALTKILSTHLQDNPDLINERSMKVIFKDNNGKLEPVLAPSESTGTQGKEELDTTDIREGRIEAGKRIGSNQVEDLDEDYEVIEFDNEGNYHVCEKGTDEDSTSMVEDLSSDGESTTKNNDRMLCRSEDRDIEGSKPVSYTHLDVYKRQMVQWCSLMLWRVFARKL